MSPRAALKKVHQAAARQPAGGSGKRPRTQTGTTKRPGTNLENLEQARRSKTYSRNVEGSRDGVVSKSRGKQPVPVPIQAPDSQLNSTSDED
jgi:hypothetical protein